MQNHGKNSQYKAEIILGLEEAICESLRQKTHLITVLLNIEEANEMGCRERIIKLLQESNIKHHMLRLIQIFLKIYFIEVKVNKTLSEQILSTNGVSQGSILSVTLFLLALKNVTNDIMPRVRFGSFADNLVIYASGVKFKITKEVLQTL